LYIKFDRNVNLLDCETPLLLYNPFSILEEVDGIAINAVDILSRFVVYDDFQVDVILLLLFNNVDVCNILLLLYCKLLSTAATDTNRQ